MNKLYVVRKLHSTYMDGCISRRIKGRKHRHTAWTALTCVFTPLSFNSEDKQEVHGSHVLLVVTLSACVVGCFSSLLQYAPPMVGEAAVFLLSYLNDSVNSGEYTRTYSHWVRYDCGLWLIAWDVQIHDTRIAMRMGNA